VLPQVHSPVFHNIARTPVFNGAEGGLQGANSKFFLWGPNTYGLLQNRVHLRATGYWGQL